MTPNRDTQPDLDNAHPELQHRQTSADARGGKALVAHFDNRIVGFGFIRLGFASFVIEHLYVSPIDS